jgi:hypothetical protein
MCNKLFPGAGPETIFCTPDGDIQRQAKDTGGRMKHFTTSSLLGAPPRRLATLLRPAALVLSVTLVTAKLAAQPGGSRGPDGPPATFALSDVTATYAFSSEGDIERNGKIGTAEITHYEFEASFSLPAPDTWMFSTALAWKRDELELTGAVPLPKELEEIGLNFMAMKDLSRELGPGWSTMLMLSPSFSSDAGKISGDSFSLFGMATIGKEVSPTFSWNVGLVGMTRGDMKVIPMLGVNWRFAPNWELAVGFPRTGVSYQFSEALRLNAEVSMQGGTYYLTKAPAAGLGHTYLDYRETRVGLGAEYQFSPNLSVALDGGMVLDREFDYYDRGLKLDGKSASFGRCSLRYRF